MCTELTFNKERSVGLLWGLCDQPVPHLLELLSMDPAVQPQPATHLLETLTAAASLMVVEYDYFDLDYRSEFSAIHQNSFQTRYPEAVRLHFFGGATVATRRHLDVIVRERREQHRGYVVIRPQKPGPIGRSMVAPSSVAKDSDGTDWLRDHVRIVVPESIQVFGVAVTTVGVPFMEQDGHLMRCAHVSAWMCHYSAVLRGMVVRRPTAEFHSASGAGVFAYGRGYPSLGLTTSSLSTIVSYLDLPPEVLDRSSLSQRRSTLAWPDNDAFREQIRTAEALDDDAEAADTLDRIWITANLTASLCRYLNSGVPSILSREGRNHTQVAVGYVRNEDMPSQGDNPERTGHSDVVALIVSDDQEGPFEVVRVSELVDEVMAATTSVIVPLPRGVHVPGSLAERAATQLFHDLTQARVLELRTRAVDSRAAALFLADLESFADGLHNDRGGPYTVRSYAATGTDFKASFRQRVAHPATARLLALMQLPKYVWVSEVIDRTYRDAHEPSVLATTVFDASAATTDRSNFADLPPLFVHLPGQAIAIGATDPSSDGDLSTADRRWITASNAPYPTGRWSHERSDLLAPDRVASRLKGATPGL